MPFSLSSTTFSKVLTKEPAFEYEKIVGGFRAYFTPILAIVGIIGCILVILIFIVETKLSRFSVYSVSLAFIHLISLIVNSFMDDFLGRGLSHALGHYLTAFKWDIHSDISCKFMEYVPNTMFFISSFITVLFSIDRLITIYEPLKFHSVYYIKYSIIACACAFVIGFGINIPLLLSHGLVKQHTEFGITLKCTVIVDKDKELLADFGLYTIILGSFTIPMFIVIILNTLICLKLWQLHINRAEMTKSFDTSDSRLFPSNQNLMKNQEKEFNRVLGHLAVNVAFILLTIPLVIIIILRLYSDDQKMYLTNVYLYKSFQHLSRLFSSLKDINYACEFFIYMIFLPNFRKGFFNFFKRFSCQRKLKLHLKKKTIYNIQVILN